MNQEEKPRDIMEILFEMSQCMARIVEIKKELNNGNNNEQKTRVQK